MKNKVVLIKPIITEKTMNLVNLENKYTFLVDRYANKIEVEESVSKKYKVTVLGVNIINTVGKLKRFGRKRTEGRKQTCRKAIVTLKAKESIADFNIG